jgi:hypothetical protein
VFKGADLSDAALDENFLEQPHKDLAGVTLSQRARTSLRLLTGSRARR